MTSEQWLTQHKDNTVGPGCLLHATHISKERCVYNQEARANCIHVESGFKPGTDPMYPTCQDCERGREVKAEMKGKAKLEPKRRDRGQCIEPGCTEKVYSKRLCRKHYQNRRNQRLRGKAQALAMIVEGAKG